MYKETKKTYHVSDEVEILDGNYEDDEPFEVEAFGPFKAAEAYASVTEDKLYADSEMTLYVQEKDKPETRLTFQVTAHVKVTYKIKKRDIA